MSAKYTVYLEMENGEPLVFKTDDADDEQHAHGLAIAWAKEVRECQVYDSFAVLNKGESKAETQKKIDSGEYAVVESIDVE